MSGNRWKTWEQMDQAIERAGERAAEDGWVHPGDLIDAQAQEPLKPGEVAPKADPFKAMMQRAALGELFTRMMVVCLPPRSYGDQRRWLAGYRRMVAFAFRLSPEAFEGATGEQIAAMLGITSRAWKKQLEYVEAILAGREPPKPLPSDDDSQ